MKDRAGFLAVCADSLTEMCLYYAAAGILIMSERGWGLHLVWLLLWAAACAFAYTYVLQKPRTTPVLTGLTAALVLGGFGLFALASTTPLRFGYGFVLMVGAGMAAGLPLYFTLKRPKVLAHLTQLDVLLAALLLFLLTKDALGLDNGTIALTVIVLFLDAAAAVGLRMSEGGGGSGGSAFKASMVALISAAVLALLIGLFSLLFSRSGAVTGGVLQGIGAFFAAIGSGIETALAWLTGLFYRRPKYDAMDIDMDIPSVAAIETTREAMEFSVNTTALGAALMVIVVAAAVIIAVLLRKKHASRSVAELASGEEEGVSRTGGTAGLLWRRLRQELAFRRTAFTHRDTPAGVLVTAERLGRRRKMPRQTGESMRAYLTRLDPEGGLDPLADALDAQFYGGGGVSLGGKRCRELRRRLRRILRETAKPEP